MSDFSYHMLFLSLIVALIWHGVNALLILQNHFQFSRLTTKKSISVPEVAVCIPARNEERVISNILERLAAQTYSNFRVFVVDDQSTDGTKQIVLNTIKRFSSKSERWELLSVEQKPAGWMGKNYALHLASAHTTAPFLLFLDADVSLSPDAVERAVAEMEANSHIGLLSIWPKQEMTGIWQIAAISTMYFALLSSLPTQYTHQKPVWMPAVLWPKMKAHFAAACGQFMFFRRETYHQIGGHESVQSEVVEDVQLAKKVISSGWQVLLKNGTSAVSCRMYASNEELENGFRKNFFAGFGYKTIPFLALGMIHLVAYFVPFIGIFYPNDIIFWLSFGTLVLSILSRMILFRQFEWPLHYALSGWLGVLWFQRLAVLCLFDFFTGKKALWKGREV